MYKYRIIFFCLLLGATRVDFSTLWRWLSVIHPIIRALGDPISRTRAVDSVLRETRINYNVYRTFSGLILRRGANIGRRYMHNIVKPGSPSLCTEGLRARFAPRRRTKAKQHQATSLQLSMCGYMFLLPGVCFYEEGGGEKGRNKRRSRWA